MESGADGQRERADALELEISRLRGELQEAEKAWKRWEKPEMKRAVCFKPFRGTCFAFVPPPLCIEKLFICCKSFVRFL